MFVRLCLSILWFQLCCGFITENKNLSTSEKGLNDLRNYLEIIKLEINRVFDEKLNNLQQALEYSSKHQNKRSLTNGRQTSFQKVDTESLPKVIQEFKTISVHAFAVENVNNELFVVISGKFRPPNDNTYIWLWNNSKKQLQLFASVMIRGAIDLETFSINGKLYLIATLNERADFKDPFVRKTQLFEIGHNSTVVVQSFLTVASTKWKTFKFSNSLYLVQASYLKFKDRKRLNRKCIQERLKASKTVEIYQWKEFGFKKIQTISGSYVTDLEICKFQSKIFLIVANRRFANVDRSSVFVYEVLTDVGGKIKFQLFQDLPAFAPRDVHCFYAENSYFVAIANEYRTVMNQRFYDTESSIFRFNGLFFTAYQQVKSIGAVKWNSFLLHDGPERSICVLHLKSHDSRSQQFIYSQKKWNPASLPVLENVQNICMITDDFYVISRPSIAVLQWKQYNHAFDHSVNNLKNNFNSLFQRLEANALKLKTFKNRAYKVDESVLHPFESKLNKSDESIVELEKIGTEQSTFRVETLIVDNLNVQRLIGNNMQVRVINDVDFSQFVDEVVKVIPKSENKLLVNQHRFKDLRLEGEVTLTGTLNGFAFQSFAVLSRSNVFTAPKTIDHLIVDDSLFVTGVINGYESNNILLKFGDQDMNSDLVIEGNVQMHNLKVKSGIVDGIDWNLLTRTAIPIDKRSSNIQGNVNFTANIVTNELIVNGLINGVNVTDVYKTVLTYDKFRNGPNLITFKSLEVLRDVMVEHKIVNNYVFPDQFVRLNSQIWTIPELIFKDVVTDSIIVRRRVNGLDLLLDILLSDGFQTIEGRKHLTHLSFQNISTVNGNPNAKPRIYIDKLRTRNLEIYGSLYPNIFKLKTAVYNIYDDVYCHSAVFESSVEVADGHKWSPSVTSALVPIRSEDAMAVHIKSMNNVKFLNSIIVKGPVDGVYIDELLAQSVCLSRNWQIVNRLIFADEVITSSLDSSFTQGNGFEFISNHSGAFLNVQKDILVKSIYSDEIFIVGSLSNVNLVQFFNDTLLSGVGQYVFGSKKIKGNLNIFGNNVAADNFKVSDQIEIMGKNVMHLFRDAVLVDSALTFIDSEIEFTQSVVAQHLLTDVIDGIKMHDLLHGSLLINESRPLVFYGNLKSNAVYASKLNNVSVDYFLLNVARFGHFSMPHHIKFEKVVVNNNLLFSGTINGIKISELVSVKDKVVIFKNSKWFKGFVHVCQNITAKRDFIILSNSIEENYSVSKLIIEGNLLVKNYLDGMLWSSFINNSIFNTENKSYGECKLHFKKIILVNELSVTGLVNNINLQNMVTIDQPSFIHGNYFFKNSTLFSKYLYFKNVTRTNINNIGIQKMISTGILKFLGPVTIRGPISSTHASSPRFKIKNMILNILEVDGVLGEVNISEWNLNSIKLNGSMIYINSLKSFDLLEISKIAVCKFGDMRRLKEEIDEYFQTHCNNKDQKLIIQNVKFDNEVNIETGIFIKDGCLQINKGTTPLTTVAIIDALPARIKATTLVNAEKTKKPKYHWPQSSPFQSNFPFIFNPKYRYSKTTDLSTWNKFSLTSPKTTFEKSTKGKSDIPGSLSPQLTTSIFGGKEWNTFATTNVPELKSNVFTNKIKSDLEDVNLPLGNTKKYCNFGLCDINFIQPEEYLVPQTTFDDFVIDSTLTMSSSDFEMKSLETSAPESRAVHSIETLQTETIGTYSTEKEDFISYIVVDSFRNKTDTSSDITVTSSETMFAENTTESNESRNTIQTSSDDFFATETGNETKTTMPSFLSKFASTFFVDMDANQSFVLRETVTTESSVLMESVETTDVDDVNLAITLSKIDLKSSGTDFSTVATSESNDGFQNMTDLESFSTKVDSRSTMFDVQTESVIEKSDADSEFSILEQTNSTSSWEFDTELSTSKSLFEVHQRTSDDDSHTELTTLGVDMTSVNHSIDYSHGSSDSTPCDTESDCAIAYDGSSTKVTTVFNPLTDTSTATDNLVSISVVQDIEDIQTVFVPETTVKFRLTNGTSTTMGKIEGDNVVVSTTNKSVLTTSISPLRNESCSNKSCLLTTITEESISDLTYAFSKAETTETLTSDATDETVESEILDKTLATDVTFLPETTEITSSKQFNAKGLSSKDSKEILTFVATDEVLLTEGTAETLDATETTMQIGIISTMLPSKSAFKTTATEMTAMPSETFDITMISEITELASQPEDKVSSVISKSLVTEASDFTSQSKIMETITDASSSGRGKISEVTVATLLSESTDTSLPSQVTDEILIPETPDETLITEGDIEHDHFAFTELISSSVKSQKITTDLTKTDSLSSTDEVLESEKLFSSSEASISGSATDSDILTTESESTMVGVQTEPIITSEIIKASTATTDADSAISGLEQTDSTSSWEFDTELSTSKSSFEIHQKTSDGDSLTEITTLGLDMTSVQHLIDYSHGPSDLTLAVDSTPCDSESDCAIALDGSSTKATTIFYPLTDSFTATDELASVSIIQDIKTVFVPGTTVRSRFTNGTSTTLGKIEGDNVVVSTTNKSVLITSISPLRNESCSNKSCLLTTIIEESVSDLALAVSNSEVTETLSSGVTDETVRFGILDETLTTDVVLPSETTEHTLPKHSTDKILSWEDIDETLITSVAYDEAPTSITADDVLLTEVTDRTLGATETTTLFGIISTIMSSNAAEKTSATKMTVEPSEIVDLTLITEITESVSQPEDIVSSEITKSLATEASEFIFQSKIMETMAESSSFGKSEISEVTVATLLSEATDTSLRSQVTDEILIPETTEETLITEGVTEHDNFTFPEVISSTVKSQKMTTDLTKSDSLSSTVEVLESEISFSSSAGSISGSATDSDLLTTESESTMFDVQTESMTVSEIIKAPTATTDADSKFSISDQSDSTSSWDSDAELSTSKSLFEVHQRTTDDDSRTELTTLGVDMTSVQHSIVYSRGSSDSTPCDSESDCAIAHDDFSTKATTNFNPLTDTSTATDELASSSIIQDITTVFVLKTTVKSRISNGTSTTLGKIEGDNVVVPTTNKSVLITTISPLRNESCSNKSCLLTTIIEESTSDLTSAVSSAETLSSDVTDETVLSEILGKTLTTDVALPSETTENISPKHSTDKASSWEDIDETSMTSDASDEASTTDEVLLTKDTDKTFDDSETTFKSTLLSKTSDMTLVTEITFEPHKIIDLTSEITETVSQPEDTSTFAPLEVGVYTWSSTMPNQSTEGSETEAMTVSSSIATSGTSEKTATMKSIADVTETTYKTDIETEESGKSSEIPITFTSDGRTANTHSEISDVLTETTKKRFFESTETITTEFAPFSVFTDVHISGITETPFTDITLIKELFEATEIASSTLSKVSEYTSDDKILPEATLSSDYFTTDVSSSETLIFPTGSIAVEPYAEDSSGTFTDDFETLASAATFENTLATKLEQTMSEAFSEKTETVDVDSTTDHSSSSSTFSLFDETISNETDTEIISSSVIPVKANVTKTTTGDIVGEKVVGTTTKSPSFGTSNSTSSIPKLCKNESCEIVTLETTSAESLTDETSSQEISDTESTDFSILFKRITGKEIHSLTRSTTSFESSISEDDGATQDLTSARLFRSTTLTGDSSDEFLSAEVLSFTDSVSNDQLTDEVTSSPLSSLSYTTDFAKIEMSSVDHEEFTPAPYLSSTVKSLETSAEDLTTFNIVSSEFSTGELTEITTEDIWTIDDHEAGTDKESTVHYTDAWSSTSLNDIIETFSTTFLPSQKSTFQESFETQTELSTGVSLESLFFTSETQATTQADLGINPPSISSEKLSTSAALETADATESEEVSELPTVISLSSESVITSYDSTTETRSDFSTLEDKITDTTLETATVTEIDEGSALPTVLSLSSESFITSSDSTAETLSDLSSLKDGTKLVSILASESTIATATLVDEDIKSSIILTSELFSSKASFETLPTTLVDDTSSTPCDIQAGCENIHRDSFTTEILITDVTSDAPTMTDEISSISIIMPELDHFKTVDISEPSSKSPYVNGTSTTQGTIDGQKVVVHTSKGPVLNESTTPSWNETCSNTSCRPILTPILEESKTEFLTTEAVSSTLFEVLSTDEQIGISTSGLKGLDTALIDAADVSVVDSQSSTISMTSEISKELTDYKTSTLGKSVTETEMTEMVETESSSIVGASFTTATEPVQSITLTEEAYSSESSQDLETSTSSEYSRSYSSDVEDFASARSWTDISDDEIYFTPSTDKIIADFTADSTIKPTDFTELNLEIDSMPTIQLIASDTSSESTSSSNIELELNRSSGSSIPMIDISTVEATSSTDIDWTEVESFTLMKTLDNFTEQEKLITTQLSSISTEAETKVSDQDLIQSTSEMVSNITGMLTEIIENLTWTVLPDSTSDLTITEDDPTEVTAETATVSQPSAITTVYQFMTYTEGDQIDMDINITDDEFEKIPSSTSISTESSSDMLAMGLMTLVYSYFDTLASTFSTATDFVVLTTEKSAASGQLIGQGSTEGNRSTSYQKIDLTTEDAIQSTDSDESFKLTTQIREEQNITTSDDITHEASTQTIPTIVITDRDRLETITLELESDLPNTTRASVLSNGTLTASGKIDGDRAIGGSTTNKTIITAPTTKSFEVFVQAEIDGDATAINLQTQTAQHELVPTQTDLGLFSSTTNDNSTSTEYSETVSKQTLEYAVGSNFENEIREINDVITSESRNSINLLTNLDGDALLTTKDDDSSSSLVPEVATTSVTVDCILNTTEQSDDLTSTETPINIYFNETMKTTIVDRAISQKMEKVVHNDTECISTVEPTVNNLDANKEVEDDYSSTIFTTEDEEPVTEAAEEFSTLWSTTEEE